MNLRLRGSLRPYAVLISFLNMSFGNGVAFADASHLPAKQISSQTSARLAMGTLPVKPLPYCTLTLSNPPEATGFDSFYFNSMRPANSSIVTATMTVVGEATSATINGVPVAIPTGTFSWRVPSGGTSTATGTVTGSSGVSYSCSATYTACTLKTAQQSGSIVGTTTYAGITYQISRYTRTVAWLKNNFPRLYTMINIGKQVNKYHGRSFIKFGTVNVNHTSSYDSFSDPDPYAGRDAGVRIQTFTGDWGKAECGISGTPSCATLVSSGNTTALYSLPDSTLVTLESWSANAILQQLVTFYYCE